MINFILPLFITALAVGGFFRFTDPILKEMDGLRDRQAILNQGLDHAKQLRQVQNDLLTAYNSFTTADKDRLNKLVPDSIDNVRLIIDINNIARPYNMSIRDIKIKTEEGEEESSVIREESAQRKGSVVLGFSVTGPYSNFKAFMADLSRSLRLVDIASVSFSTAETGSYDYNVELQTYWLK